MSICRDLRRGQTRASKPESLSKYTPRGTKIGKARVTSISREIFRNDNEPSWAHAARCEVSIISINPQSFSGLAGHLLSEFQVLKSLEAS